jgi:hypothetical protein
MEIKKKEIGNVTAGKKYKYIILIWTRNIYEWNDTESEKKSIFESGPAFIFIMFKFFFSL